ncbi:hypothetical protein POM88_019026 [Heracleum sosnowskyi]|uniref:Uncharacterized protein n=1 Tax=Heracleum sosnowskyi TaxID=360622 RepID=A0AAD8ITD9_9APIA|nr:hypothetical protein POM88_019026 [Heracleum sosnowskyi]
MSLRRNLGKLVVLGGEVFRKSNDTSRRTILTSIKDIYASSTIFSSFNSLHFSGYTESRHYHADAETKGGCDHTFERKIRKGDTICLNDLLFTNNRDYLIKNNNQHVKAEHLEGKVIGIYFVPLSDIDSRHSAWYTALLKDVYDDLHAANNFEAILVACDIIDSKFRKETPVHRSLLSDSQKVFEERWVPGFFTATFWEESHACS